MKKVLLFFLAVCMLLSFCACGPKSKLVGSWYCEDAWGDYPTQMTLRKDGTASVNGLSCNWSDRNGELILTSVFGSDSFKYKFEGSKLYLDVFGEGDREEMCCYTKN